MMKVLNWLKSHFKERTFKFSTILALIFIYVMIFHHADFTSFIQFLFKDAFRKFIENLVNNDAFITSIGGGIVAYLIGTKKF